MSGFGFEDLKGTRAGTTLSPEEIERSDRVAERHGFVPRDPASAQPATIQRKVKHGPAGPVGQFNLRAAVEDVNEFVDWCGRERLSYREGFARLMELWRESEIARKKAG